MTTLHRLTIADLIEDAQWLRDRPHAAVGLPCSRGARLEVDVAHALRLPVLPVAQWLEAKP